MSDIIASTLKTPTGQAQVSYAVQAGGSLEITFTGEPAKNDDDQHARRHRELYRMLAAGHGLEVLQNIGATFEQDQDKKHLVLPSPSSFAQNFSRLQPSVDLAFFAGGRFSSEQQITALANSRVSLFSLDANVYTHDILDHVIGWLVLDEWTINSIIEKAAELEYAETNRQDDFAGACDRITSQLIESLSWGESDFSAWLSEIEPHFQKIAMKLPTATQLMKRRAELMTLLKQST